jgi:hypothetical protein
MQQYTNEYLLQLFEQSGIEEGLKKIDINAVDDKVVRIILQTLHNSKLCLFQELKTRVHGKKPKA